LFSVGLIGGLISVDDLVSVGLIGTFVYVVGFD
jgi:hypothetical protein